MGRAWQGQASRAGHFNVVASRLEPRSWGRPGPGQPRRPGGLQGCRCSQCPASLAPTGERRAERGPGGDLAAPPQRIKKRSRAWSCWEETACGKWEAAGNCTGVEKNKCVSSGVGHRVGDRQAGQLPLSSGVPPALPSLLCTTGQAATMSWGPEASPWEKNQDQRHLSKSLEPADTMCSPARAGRTLWTSGELSVTNLPRQTMHSEPWMAECSLGKHCWVLHSSAVLHPHCQRSHPTPNPAGKLTFHLIPPKVQQMQGPNIQGCGGEGWLPLQEGHVSILPVSAHQVPCKVSVTRSYISHILQGDVKGGMGSGIEGAGLGIMGGGAEGFPDGGMQPDR